MTIDGEQDREDADSMAMIISESARHENMRREIEARLRKREQMEISDCLWNLTENPDSGLYAKPYWEDVMIMGDYLYKLGYRRVVEEK